jgi:hypothetical protein
MSPRIEEAPYPHTAENDVMIRVDAGLTDWAGDGILAEYVGVEARNLTPLPGSIDHIRGAALPMAGLTAWQALFDHAGLRPGRPCCCMGPQERRATWRCSWRGRPGPYHRHGAGAGPRGRAGRRRRTFCRPRRRALPGGRQTGGCSAGHSRRGRARPLRCGGRARRDPRVGNRPAEGQADRRPRCSSWSSRTTTSWPNLPAWCSGAG